MASVYFHPDISNQDLKIIESKHNKKNTIIKLNHLELQRPNFDYTGFDIKKIINKKLKIDLKKFQHIRKKHLN